MQHVQHAQICIIAILHVTYIARYISDEWKHLTNVLMRLILSTLACMHAHEYTSEVCFNWHLLQGQPNVAWTNIKCNLTHTCCTLNIACRVCHFQATIVSYLTLGVIVWLLLEVRLPFGEWSTEACWPRTNFPFGWTQTWLTHFKEKSFLAG